MRGPVPPLPQGCSGPGGGRDGRTHAAAATARWPTGQTFGPDPVGLLKSAYAHAPPGHSCAINGVGGGVGVCWEGSGWSVRVWGCSWACTH
jgi:hypothetical protein